VTNGDSLTASQSAICVLLGNGDGTFKAQQTFATGTRPSRFAVSDINGDGKLDLVVPNSTSVNVNGSMSVLLGNGDGSFQPQQTFSTGAFPLSVATPDLNGDGIPDFVVANYATNTVRRVACDRRWKFHWTNLHDYPRGAAADVLCQYAHVSWHQRNGIESACQLNDECRGETCSARPRWAARLVAAPFLKYLTAGRR